MVEDNVCESCKKCCVNASHIGLMSGREIFNLEQAIGRPVQKRSWKKFTDIYEMTEVPCPGLIDNKCCLEPMLRPCTCLLFPFRPDWDKETKEWELDLAVTKCPGALAFSLHADEAIKLFKEMKESGRWKDGEKYEK